MKQEIIRIAKEAEDSYSFAVGDEMRRSQWLHGEFQYFLFL